MSIKGKLTAGFGALLVILAALGAVGYYSIKKLSNLSALAEKQDSARFLAASIHVDVNNQKTEVRTYILSGDEAQLALAAEAKNRIGEDFAKIGEIALSQEEKRLSAELHQETDAYYGMVIDVARLRRAGKTKAAATLLLNPDHVALRAAMDNTIANFVNLEDKLKTNARAEQSAAESRAVVWTVSLAIVGIAIGFIVATLIARAISTGISRMVAMIQEIAKNNLAIPDMKILSQDELGQAGIALNGMKEQVSAVVRTITTTAEQVASASEEISAGATQTAGSSRSQADQTQQVAAAMQEMSSTVQQISESSQKAADTSRQAVDAARQGGEVVEATLSTMRHIAESTSKTASQITELGKRSEQIGKIIAVIDDIADQTNLLALNAAIEAARAGEQGRGFAVVADEVRKLAERTTKATKEITSMIESIQSETRSAVQAMEQGQREVQGGVEKTTASGAALEEIIKMSELVGDMISQIATAATEQSATTVEINSNVTQISSATEESTAAAEQTAKACTDLSGLAFDLQKLVNQFKLEPASEQHSQPVEGQPKTKAAAAAAGVSR